MDTRKPRTNIGRQVALAAFLAGVEHRELARLLGLHRQSFYLRLIGKRQWQPGELKKIAAYLGVSVDYLAGDDHDI